MLIFDAGDLMGTLENGNEIVMCKARLFEIQHEEKAIRERLSYLIGKNEGITEMEKMLEDKINEGLQKVLESRKSEVTV